MSGNRLCTVYDLSSPKAAAEFYGEWAGDYEAELADAGYATPARCAKALAGAARAPEAPLLELGCGTGLGGVALRRAGFEIIDGVDLSPEMLAKAREKNIYRDLSIDDLSQPLDFVEPGAYRNAAAIGVLNPKLLPAYLIDRTVALLPSEGCFVFSLNDHALADRSMETRVLELTEYGVADLVFKEQADHLPGIDLQSTVYVLKKR